MDKKSRLDLEKIKQISIITDILIPVALYYAMINDSNVIAWVLLGIVVMTRLALAITTK